MYWSLSKLQVYEPCSVKHVVLATHLTYLAVQDSELISDIEVDNYYY